MMTIPQNKTPLKIPLRLVLAIPFILVILLTTSIVGYIAFMNGQKAVNNVAHQLHSEVSARIEEHLHNFLIVPLQVNQFNTASMQQGWLDPNDIKKTQDYFLEQVKTHKTITSIYFGNVDGGVVGSGREGATESFYVYNTENLKAGTFNKYALTNTGQIGNLLTSVPNIDTRTRPWYINATQKGDITWNDMYILLTGQDMTIALSSPVYDNRHSLIGVLSVEIFVSQIEGFLKTLNISKTGQSFIMERSGLLVASSTGENSFIKNNDKMERLDARNSQSHMIKYAAEYLHGRFGKNYNVTNDVQFDFEVEGKRHFANASTVHDQYGIDWLIIVVIPESDFMAEITATNQSTFLITILALAISILASIFGAGRIASRISYLNKSTRAFTRGEATGLISANSRISEIDELTNSFTEMEHQLTQTLNDFKSEVSERKMIGQALRDSESLFRAIFEQAAVGVAQIETATGRFVRINQKYCDIVGYSCAEMEKMNFQTITHPDDLEVDLANMELLTAGEIREFTIEKRYFRKSGETIWVSLTSSPMWAAGETPNYHIAIVHDITARKQTEMERKTLLEIMQGLVVTKDLHDFLGIIHHSIAKVIYAENFFVLLHNKDTGLFEEIYSVDKFDPPGAPSRLEKSISAYVFNSGQPYLMTQAHFDELAARGEVELVGTNSPSWLGVPLKAPGKETALHSETIGVMVVQNYDKPNSYTERDIDFLASIAGQVALVIKRKQAEDLLAQTHQNYETFFNTIDEFLFVLDEQGNIIHTNTTVIDRLGYTSEELFRKSVIMLHPPERRDEVSRIVAEMLSGVTEFCPVPIVTKSGVQIPVETRVSHGFWDGEPVIFGVTKDISKVRLSEEKFSKVFHLNPSACGLSDLVTRKYVEVNEAFYTLLGFDKDEVIGKTASDIGILTPDALKSLALKADSNGSITNAEADLRAKNGAIKHVLLSAENISVQDKKYRFTVVHDITERNQAEETLRASEENLLAILNATHDSACLVDTDGRYIFLNESLAKGLGKSVSELVGTLSTESVPKSVAETRLAYLNQVVQSAKPLEFDNSRDGRHFSIRYWPVLDLQRHTKAVAVFASDITARVQAEEALRVALAKYKTLFEYFPLGITVSDAAGNILESNPIAEKMLGISQDEQIRRDIDSPEWRIVRTDGTPMPPDEFASMQALKEKRVVENMEMGIVKPDHTITWLSVTAAPLPVEEYGIVITYGDITERKRAEDALRISEEKFRRAFAISPDSININRLQDGMYLTINNGFTQIMGYTPEECIGKTSVELNIWDRAQDREALVEGLAKRGEVVNLEARFRTKNGDIKYGLMSAAVLTINDVKHIISITRDITARKQSEEDLRKSETRLRSILDATPFPIALVDLQDNNIYFWSQSALALFGHTAPTTPEWYQIAYPNPDYRRDVIERWKPILEKARLTNQAVNTGEYRVTCRDGSVRICELYAAFLADRLIVTFNDITERKMAEERLRSSKEQYRILFDHLPIPAFTKDINGIYISCNEENLKYWATNPVGHTDAEISPSEIALALHANDQRVIESGETVVADELLKSTPMGDRLFITHKVPLRDGSGNIIGVLGASLDITERKRIEDDILEKSKELEALFTISSHLRTAQTADDMLPVVLAQMSQVLNADANSVILLNPDQTRFTFAVCGGLLTSSAGLQFDLENSISGHVMQTRQPYVTLDYANDPLRSGVVLDGTGIGTMVVVPLQSETEFIGTLLCGRAKDSHTKTFTPAEVQLLVSIGEMVGNALRRARLYEDALLRLHRVKGLHSIDLYINANWDIKGTLKLIVTQALPLMTVDAAAILYYNQNLHILEYASAQGFHYKAIEKTRFALSGTFSEKAILERRVLTASDLSEIQDPVHKEMMQKEGFVACFVTPMIAKGKVIGVLELYTRTPLHLDQEWLDFLESIGAQAAIAIDHARLFRDIQTSNFELIMAYDATIQGWSYALELKDRETEGHTLRVTETTVSLAKLAGLNEKEITHIRRGALLHDIGKMGIPDHILNKIGKLTSKEWVIIRQHPQNAYNLLHRIEYLRPALDIPYCHHEKWDGTGYPQGLQNLQIPYAARIFAVVDVWDALTNDRVYRKAWPQKKAIAHIKKQSGKHFDPQAVELFLKYMDALAKRKE